VIGFEDGKDRRGSMLELSKDRIGLESQSSAMEGGGKQREG
jgi:hypothetical protein